MPDSVSASRYEIPIPDGNRELGLIELFDWIAPSVTAIKSALNEFPSNGAVLNTLTVQNSWSVQSVKLELNWLTERFRAVSEQFPSNFRAISEQFWGSFRAVSGQFPGSFRAVFLAPRNQINGAKLITVNVTKSNHQLIHLKKKK